MDAFGTWRGRSRIADGTRAIGLLGALALSLFGLLVSAHRAEGLTIYKHPHVASIDGSTSAPGSFGDLDHLAIDQTKSTLYVLDRAHGAVVHKYNAAVTPPVPENFTATGTNTVVWSGGGGDPDITVDNSGTATQGRIYTISESGSVTRAFEPSGTQVGAGFPLGGLSIPCGGAVDPQGNLWVGEWGSARLGGFASNGTPLPGPGGPTRPPNPFNLGFNPCHFAIDETTGNPTSGWFYVGPWSGPVNAYNPAGELQFELDPMGGTRGVAVDPSNGDIYVYHPGNGLVKRFAASAVTGVPGPQISEFGGEDLVNNFPGLCGGQGGIAVDGATHLVYVGDCNGQVQVFGPGAELIVPTVTTDLPTVTPTGATLRGHVDTDGGGDTSECFFEWGPTQNYGQKAVCQPEGPIKDEDGNTEVTADIENLVQGGTYHYRLVATNVNGDNKGVNRSFKPQGKPEFEDARVSEVNTDGARISATVIPSGGETTYHLEWGPDPCSSNPCTALAQGETADNKTPAHPTTYINGLSPDTEYHFRVVAENELGESTSDDLAFTTFATNPGGSDPCPNALERKQTGSSLLMDCRAYELVSSADTGGYDVASDVLSGQTPIAAVPTAVDRLVYSVRFGAILGVPGDPTNFGLDPYVAERGASGWVTRYAGLSASATPSANPFSSAPLDTDADLSTFAFGGPNLCSPCFADGSTGIPVRVSGGQPVQGMAGALDPGAAEPDGYVPEHLSADGSHLVFGSAAQFEPDGNANGDVSIYKRNLASGTTDVISKTPGGANLACLGGAGTCHSPGDPRGIAALGISSNGSRVVVAQRIYTDGQGNDYWHPYMHVGSSPGTIDLAPGTTGGVIFAGMSADGSRVFLVSDDQLTADDTDASADLFRADVSSGSAELTRVSTGSSGTGNGDGCDPVESQAGADWNRVSGGPDCSVVAIGGGGGVASGDGTVYLLSPERLDGPSNGTEGEPNLYVVEPGSTPEFVTTVRSNDLLVRRAVLDSETRNRSDFQLTPDGAFAVFSTTVPVTGYPTDGHDAIYRHESATGQLDCASCPPTGATLTANTRLSASGLNVADDGRVFFSSLEPLALRDTNGYFDAYEWHEGDVQLISTGTGNFDSGLLTVSHSGVDAFFYTRETLSPQDRNGNLMKVYSAREGGGFLFDPRRPPCQASDECHGPGTQAAPPPSIQTIAGTGRPHPTQRAKRKRCGKGKVFRKARGKCVKRKQSRKKKRRSRSRGNG